jgi:hypothetical protein
VRFKVKHSPEGLISKNRKYAVKILRICSKSLEICKNMQLKPKNIQIYAAKTPKYEKICS